MEYLENDTVQIHQESIRRAARIQQAIRGAGLDNPLSVDRALTFIGDLLIRLGTRLKDRAYTKLTTEEATSPSFLIML